MAATSLHDITELIDKKGTYGLNIADKFPFTNLFIGDAKLMTRSDSDEQLLLHIAFNEAVCLQGIKLIAGEGKLQEGPKTVKLYANRISVSFSDVDSLPPTQTLELGKDDLGSETSITPLKQVLFNRVNSISIFVESNQDDEEITTLGGLRLYGKTLGSTNMSQLKKVGGEE
jgi:hypothetical protein